MRPGDTALAAGDDSEFVFGGKEDPRRRDIGFDQWMQFKGAAVSIGRPDHDNLLYYSEAQMRHAWIEGYKAAERECAAHGESTKEK